MIDIFGTLREIIDFKSLKKEQIRLFALVGVFALIAVIVYVNFILAPQVRWALSNIVKAGKAAAELNKAKSDITGIDKFKQTIDSYRAKTGSYEKMLPSENQITAILEELSSLAKGAGVKIVGITPLAVKKDGGKDRIDSEMPIVITAKSGYHELGRFIDTLENCGILMKISDIQIRLNRSTLKKHDVELLVVTYLLKG